MTSSRLIKDARLHCIFCGTHGPSEDFRTQIGPPDHPKAYTVASCPYCREYKGIEECNPNTCTCWEIAVARNFAERIRRQKSEGDEYLDR
jgi:hypothetical protein